MIRRASEKDLRQIDSLLEQVLTVHADGRPDIFIPGTKKYTDAELTEMFADDSRPVFVFTDENDVTVGYAFCVIEEIRGENNLRDRKMLYIDDLCVDEAHRGQHIASELYAYVRQYAKEIGCYHITLNVWELNPGAKKFYEAMGMKPLKTVMEDVLCTEREAIRMKKAARMLLAVSLAAVLGFLTACSPDPAPDGPLTDENADAPSYDIAESHDVPEPEPVSADSEPILLKAAPYLGEFRTGCEGEANNGVGIELEFTVELDRTEYRCGDTVSLRTSARNIGSTFRYVPSYGAPEPWLEHTDYVNGTSDLDGYGKYSICRPSYPIPEDIPQPELCEPGDTWNQSVEITIPSDAPTGMYDILIYSHGYTTIVKNAIEIVR